MGRLTRSEYAVVLVSVPAVALAIGWVVVLALTVVWRHPMWGLTPRNPSEAAAFRDGAAIVLMVRQGRDINAAGAVRAGFISSDVVTVTPLEAAVDARRPEILRLLFYQGAAPDAAAWSTIWCKAEDDEIRVLLDAHRPVGATATCPERQDEP